MTVIGLCKLCLASCDAAALEDHAGEAAAATSTASVDNHVADFVTYLADRSPAEHVQNLYDASSTSESIFAWMIDASWCVEFRR